MSQEKFRRDYVAPHYTLTKTNLDFTLDPEKTLVRSELKFVDYDTSKDLVLNGEYMQLQEVTVNGEKPEYYLDDHTLTLRGLPEQFTLKTTVLINPAANTRLMGLYVSNGRFCTQCEPEGFRSITYYPDHPDVPSRWRVTIHADRKKYPVVLSNGNKVAEDEEGVVFEDPFNKPCYLFALVAGDLASIKDTFTTMSGKNVDLTLYCEPAKKERLSFAMESLKKAMKWDEERFGREYDLDRFSIVAVSDFNAGAMENKSLNIFNDSALLASPDTATDATYEYIERVVGHEYFHNWSGDRVTVNQWFELSLKEGFTVFRDQEFSYDVRSRAICRIDDAMDLRRYQFPEDDGPLAHPVRPFSFKEIENFYTTTIYEKGAELIRMQQSLLGDQFRPACDLYFERNDGKAVSIDEFVGAMQDTGKIDLTQFKLWYDTPGRPKVSAKTTYDEETKQFIVDLTQTHRLTDKPFVIPLHYGLVGADGKDIKKGVFVFNQSEQRFILEDISEKPVLSLNRFFACPIDLEIDYTPAERICLMKYDSDLFNRYDVGHQYALAQMVKMIQEENPIVDTDVLDALGSYLTQPGLDKAFVARAIGLPSEDELMEKVHPVDLIKIKQVRRLMRQAFAEKYKDTLVSLYQANQTEEAYSPDKESVAKRSLKNAALSYLVLTDQSDLAWQQFKTANNLTDRLTALSLLVHYQLDHAQEALDLFYNRYQADDLVLNKWFAVQASNPNENVLPVVEKLLSHEKFVWTNPNKVRHVLGVFGRNNGSFHTKEGYQFLANKCAYLDKINPKIAANLLTLFASVRQFDGMHQTWAKEALTPLLNNPEISINARENIERII